jgi:hypothetical protein
VPHFVAVVKKTLWGSKLACYGKGFVQAHTLRVW